MNNMLTLTAVNSYGKEIRKSCAISLILQRIHFEYQGAYHTIAYKQSRKGHYFTLKGIRYYFKVYNNITNNWLIDCDCF